MAANLEAEVRVRERNTRSIKCLMESQGGAKGHPEPRDTGDSTNAEESISALGDCIADLRSALSEEEDPSKSLEFLNRAWKIAEESVARLAT